MRAFATSHEAHCTGRRVAESGGLAGLKPGAAPTKQMNRTAKQQRGRTGGVQGTGQGHAWKGMEAVPHVAQQHVGPEGLEGRLAAEVQKGRGLAGEVGAPPQRQPGSLVLAVHPVRPVCQQHTFQFDQSTVMMDVD